MLNGTTTLGGHNTTYCDTVHPGCHYGWSAAGMTCLWSNWSIQLFVLLGLILQIVLAVVGSRRKTSSGDTIRFVIWASFLLASYIPTVALSKLTTVNPNKSEEGYITELKALLAPLTLLLVGNPDSITAYSAEDNQVGLRSTMNFVITLSYVVWILGRCWKNSNRMMLFFPMFVAGIIKCGETLWALYSVNDANMNMRSRDLEEEKELFSSLMNFRGDVPGLEIFLRASYRFNCLKPHIVDWSNHPFFVLRRSASIDEYSPEDVFLITEMELGFMYDVLYTKALVLYTMPGITLRVISYFSMLLTLGGFMWLFFDKLLRDPYVIYTFGLLIGVVLLETYQLWMLFYSDWVIIRYNKLSKNPMVLKFLKFLVKRSLMKERWCNRIRQFNFLDFCQSYKRPWLFRILKVCGMANKFMRYLAPSSMPIPMYLKPILLEDMRKFETKRAHGPFTKRGKWTLDIHGSLDKLKWSIEMTFDRSIIIWHIATHICHYSCHEESNRKEASKLISDYMMFLLVDRQILSLTLVEINYHHAYTNLKTLSNKFPGEDVLNVLLGSEPLPAQESGALATVITEGWNVLEEVRRLVRELQGTADTWELISSVWVEMLCFAAYNCQQYHHMKLLRRGGEIITHVWLLLSHKTDKFKTMEDLVESLEIEKI